MIYKISAIVVYVEFGFQIEKLDCLWIKQLRWFFKIYDGKKLQNFKKDEKIINNFFFFLIQIYVFYFYGH